MKSKNGASATKEYTLEQFVGAMSWFFYGCAYDGHRWKRQGEQGYCWWDKQTHSYISTSELYELMIEEMKHYNPDWTAM